MRTMLCTPSSSPSDRTKSAKLMHSLSVLAEIETDASASTGMLWLTVRILVSAAAKAESKSRPEGLLELLERVLGR